MINKNLIFFTSHVLIIALLFALRFLGVAADYLLIGTAVIMSMEAIYIALFTKAAANKASICLNDMKKDMAKIREDASETAKLHQALIYAGHQIKTIQQELDFLKKQGVKLNGNGHRRVHHPIISHS